MVSRMQQAMPTMSKRKEPGERTRKGRLGLLTEMLLGRPPRYSYTDIASAAGVGPERAEQMWQSFGLATPERSEVMFTDLDAEMLRLAAQLDRHGLDFSTVLVSARAAALAMSRVCDWQVDLVRTLAERRASTFASPDDIELLATEALRELWPVLEQLQSHVWRRQFVASADRLLTTMSRATDPAPQVVGFADVVGFTNISRGLDERELAAFIEDFEARAISTVTAGGGRVVKTIGDEVLFEVDHVEHGARIALNLAGQRSSLDDRPNLHVGLAYGPVLHQHGDIFGAVVNLASRLTSLARPGTVLVDTAFAAELRSSEARAGESRSRSALIVRALRPVTMRGFEHLQPWLLRADSAADTAS